MRWVIHQLKYYSIVKNIFPGTVRIFQSEFSIEFIEFFKLALNELQSNVQKELHY